MKVNSWASFVLAAAINGKDRYLFFWLIETTHFSSWNNSCDGQNYFRR